MSYLAWVLTGLAIFAAVAFAFVAVQGQPAAVPDKIEKLGCLEIVTKTRFQRTGWTTGQLGWAAEEDYYIRSGGRTLEVKNPTVREGAPTTPETTFNAVFLFPSPQTALVVNAGDPNNTSQYYLVRCEGARAAVAFLGNSRSGNVSAAWADPPPSAPGRIKFSGLRRFDGGRFLLLGGSIVLDIATLKHYAVPGVDGFAFDFDSFSAPLSGSPDKQSFAIYATTQSPESHPSMGVFNFIAGETYHLRLDLKRMRFNLADDIDQAWFGHHFEWISVSGRPDRLEPRKDFTPLPYKGHRMTEGVRVSEYRMLHVAAEMQAVVIQLFQAEFKAELLPPKGEPNPELNIRELTIDGHVLNVSARHKGGDAYVSFWFEQEPKDGLWARLADRMDQELATGRHDHLFHQDQP